MDIVGALNYQLNEAGVTSDTKVIGDYVYVTYHLPTLPRATHIRARVRISDFMPQEVGAGKIAKKIVAKAKAAAKKVANNKVFKAVVKVAKPLAKMMPGGNALTAAVKTAKVTAKLVKAAKGGNPKAAKLLKAPVVMKAAPKPAAKPKPAPKPVAKPKAAPKPAAKPKPAPMARVAPAAPIMAEPPQSSQAYDDGGGGGGGGGSIDEAEEPSDESADDETADDGDGIEDGYGDESAPEQYDQTDECEA